MTAVRLLRVASLNRECAPGTGLEVLQVASEERLQLLGSVGDSAVGVMGAKEMSCVRCNCRFRELVFGQRVVLSSNHIGTLRTTL
jgi:hypothetical protein